MLLTTRAFRGLNIGLIGFLVGLALDTRTFSVYWEGGPAPFQILKQVSSSIMGLRILAIIAGFILQLVSGRDSEAQPPSQASVT